MARFSVGDHVSWNSEAGRVTGKIIKVHHEDFDYKGHRHRASKDDPQYEIQSDKTDHIAAQVVSRTWWKFSGGDLRALGFGPDQATRSRVIGSMG